MRLVRSSATISPCLQTKCTPTCHLPTSQTEVIPIQTEMVLLPTHGITCGCIIWIIIKYVIDIFLIAFQFHRFLRAFLQQTMVKEWGWGDQLSTSYFSGYCYSSSSSCHHPLFLILTSPDGELIVWLFFLYTPQFDQEERFLLWVQILICPTGCCACFYIECPSIAAMSWWLTHGSLIHD